jgi:hypothetical protein
MIAVVKQLILYDKSYQKEPCSKENNINAAYTNTSSIELTRVQTEE